MTLFHRRGFLTASAAGLAAACIPGRSRAGDDAADAGSSAAKASGPSLVAITLDLEMSAQYPKPADTEWNYEKGNLNAETKAYSLEAARRVKAAGGRLHFFAVGRVLEQPNVDWLKELAADGHPIGNHTYDHVNVWAQRLEDLQFRFRRAPWLIDGKSAAEVIDENIRLTDTALRMRVGIESAGFRTPGGSPTGLIGREDVQKRILSHGFHWVSSLYPTHAAKRVNGEVPESVFDDIANVQAKAQPFVYPTGLVELPLSPISDVSAFRAEGWNLDQFLAATERAVTACINTGRVFDFLGHPSCLYVVDPEFKTIDLICRLVKHAGDKARLATLDEIAAQWVVKAD